MIEERDVYHTLFGNIGSMKDLFLEEGSDGKMRPPPSTTPVPDDEDLDVLDLSLPEAFQKFNRANLTNHTFDIHDFLVINEKYSDFAKEYKKKMKNALQKQNQTRRFFSRVYNQDPDDYNFGEHIEELKRRQIMMVMVQFVMHCRYEVGKVLLQRDLVRSDKRYKLGYLFNRMRRLKTEQLKMVGTSWLLVHGNAYRHMYTQMRQYERVVHFDVDMRDTARLIQRIFAVDAPFDRIELKKQKP